MESRDDLELDGDDTSRAKSSKDVRKNISIKLKGGSGRSRGRPRKGSRSTRSTTKKKDVLEEKTAEEKVEAMEEFSTMKVTGDEPTHKTQKLKWNHKVNLIGMKVVDPIIHTCETCMLPILIYGRMIPCKHVFCFDCAKKTDKICPRCTDPVNRVEQSALGAVFVCNFGGSKHGTTGCRRTYLSQRDLQAHVNYRHLKEQAEQQAKQVSSSQSQQAPPPAPPVQQVAPPQSPITSPGPVQPFGMALASPPLAQAMLVTAPPPQQKHDQKMMYTQQQQAPPPPHQQHRTLPDNMSHGQPPLQQQQHLAPGQMHTGIAPPPAHQTHPPPAHNPAPLLQTRLPPPVSSHLDNFHSIPVMSTRTSNLITVPIQDENDYSRRDGQYQPGGITVSQGMQFHHPAPGQNMAGPQHYSPVSHNQHNAGPMMNPPPFSTTGPPPPPQNMVTSHPPPMGGPRSMNINMSQPPPTSSMPHTGVPPPPRQGPPTNTHGAPPGPPMGNRYPNPRPPTFDKSNVYGQPPPNNPRTWQGGPPPPPSGPIGSGPPPRPQTNSTNMGPPQTRPFYQ